MVKESRKEKIMNFKEIFMKVVSIMVNISGVINKTNSSNIMDILINEVNCTERVVLFKLRCPNLIKRYIYGRFFE